MAPHLDPDHPPTSSWAVAAVAALLALGGALALWWLADEWATEPESTNLYTLVAAIGGVVVFEFSRFAVTIRRRHRRAVEDQFRLRDVRAEQLRDLLEEVAASRQALQAIEAAIEIRAREQNLRARRERAGRALDDVADELEAIRAEEHLLDVDASELGLTEEAARRLNEALAQLEPQLRPRRSILELTVGTLPLGLGAIALPVLEFLEKELERHRMQRLSRAEDRDVEPP